MAAPRRSTRLSIRRLNEPERSAVASTGPLVPDVYWLRDVPAQQDVKKVKTPSPNRARTATNPYARNLHPTDFWGECPMCLEKPRQPQGCNQCLQLIGCDKCIKKWYEKAQDPSCPLCRNDWTDKIDVSPIATVARRQRAEARAKRQKNDNPSSSSASAASS